MKTPRSPKVLACLSVLLAIPISAHAIQQGDVFKLYLGAPTPSHPTTDSTGFDYAAAVEGNCGVVQRATYASYLLKTNVGGSKLELKNCGKDSDGHLACEIKILTGSYRDYYWYQSDGYVRPTGSSGNERFSFIPVDSYKFSSQNLGNYQVEVYKIRDPSGRYMVVGGKQSDCGVNYLRFDTKDAAQAVSVTLGS
ncbi:hypothetical protein J5226_01720 [Lysobacter sp. K5869]|uniref:hypothetical protein n=1 Tax=Lysobacter sp. K5869 TaxID=2820808 RepID=UPI001C064979|nr:hypothetical protein [Lysobacter sp. K5869]QWP77149.1 hypothetical protein J5226_01720 [Lysobacter sp. K5869]